MDRSYDTSCSAIANTMHAKCQSYCLPCRSKDTICSIALPYIHRAFKKCNQARSLVLFFVRFWTMSRLVSIKARAGGCLPCRRSTCDSHSGPLTSWILPLRAESNARNDKNENKELQLLSLLLHRLCVQVKCANQISFDSSADITPAIFPSVVHITTFH